MRIYILISLFITLATAYDPYHTEIPAVPLPIPAYGDIYPTVNVVDAKSDPYNPQFIVARACTYVRSTPAKDEVFHYIHVSFFEDSPVILHEALFEDYFEGETGILHVAISNSTAVLSYSIDNYIRLRVYQRENATMWSFRDVVTFYTEKDWAIVLHEPLFVLHTTTSKNSGKVLVWGDVSSSECYGVTSLDQCSQVVFGSIENQPQLVPNQPYGLGIDVICPTLQTASQQCLVDPIMILELSINDHTYWWRMKQVSKQQVDSYTMAFDDKFDCFTEYNDGGYMDITRLAWAMGYQTPINYTTCKLSYEEDPLSDIIGTFLRIDKDGDGKLNKAEVKNYFFDNYFGIFGTKDSGQLSPSDVGQPFSKTTIFDEDGQLYINMTYKYAKIQALYEFLVEKSSIHSEMCKYPISNDFPNSDAYTVIAEDAGDGTCIYVQYMPKSSTLSGVVFDGWPRSTKEAMRDFKCPTLQASFIAHSALSSTPHILPSKTVSRVIQRSHQPTTALSALAVISCGPGYFQNGSKCEACHPGTIQPNKLLGDCIKCPAGRYNDESGSSKSECMFCDPGTWSSTIGASSVKTCRACPPGLFGSGIAVSRASRCFPCLQGTYSDDGKECKACQGCQPLSTSPKGVIELPAGTKAHPPYPAPQSSGSEQSVSNLIYASVGVLGLGLVLLSLTFLPGSIVGIKFKDGMDRGVDMVAGWCRVILTPPEKQVVGSRIHVSIGLILLSLICGLLAFHLTMYINENQAVNHLPLQTFGGSNYTTILAPYLNQAFNMPISITLDIKGWFGSCDLNVDVVDGNGMAILQKVDVTCQYRDYGTTVTLTRPAIGVPHDIEEYRIQLTDQAAYSTGIRYTMETGSGAVLNVASGEVYPSFDSCFRGIASPTKFDVMTAPALYISASELGEGKVNTVVGGLYVTKEHIQSGGEVGVSITSFNASTTDLSLGISVRVARASYFHIITKSEKVSLSAVLFSVVSQIGGALSFIKLVAIAFDRKKEKKKVWEDDRSMPLVSQM